VHNIAELFQKEDYEPGEEEKLSEIEYVNIRRSIDGAWATVRRQYTIDEVATSEALYAQLGPGSYELTARNDKNSRIITKVRVLLAPEPGDPRAFGAPPVREVAETPAIPASENSADRMLMFMVTMQQQQAKQSADMMLAMMTLITGVMSSGSANADKYTAQMSQLFTSFGTQQTALLQSVMASKQSTDPQEMLLKGVELANELRAGANEGKAEPSVGSELQETMGMIAQGVDLYNKVKGPAGVVAAVTAEES
jgi:hypothetical protein